MIDAQSPAFATQKRIGSLLPSARHLCSLQFLLGVHWDYEPGLSFVVSNQRTTILPLLGERAGVRASVSLAFFRNSHRPRIIRQRAWRSLLQLVENRITDTLRVAPQMRIPKAKRLDAARLQIFLPLSVMSLLMGMTMLTAVQFNGQFCLFAEKIEIIAAQRMLPPEFITAKASVPQPAPYQLFRPGFLLAQLSGICIFGHEQIVRFPCENRISFLARPHLYPLPQERM